MQKLIIAVPREKYYYKAMFLLGKSKQFQLIDIEKDKIQYELFDSSAKVNLESILRKIDRLIEKFKFRNIQVLLNNAKIKNFTFNQDEFSAYLSTSSKLVTEIEEKVSRLELKEGEIEKNIQEFTSSEDGENFPLIKSLNNEKKALTTEIKDYFTRGYEKILVTSKELHFIYNYINIFEKTGGNDLIAVIMGWIPKESGPTIKKDIDKLTNNSNIIKLLDPEKGELPPTLIKVGKLSKPFQALTAQYGVPNYFELNPTKILAILFPLLFGLMFGDVGQGIAIMLFSYYYIRKTNRSIAKIMFWCGLSACIVGLFYGEFFGYSFHDLGWMTPWFACIPTLLPFLPVYNLAGHSFVESNFLLLIKFSLLIGAFILSFGYALQFVNNWRKKEYGEALGSSLPTLLFVVFFMYCFFLFGLSFMEYFVNITILTLYLPPLIFILIPIFIMLFAKLFMSRFSVFRLHKSKGSIFGESALHVWESGLGFISNISSFLRIFALIISHWALMTVFKTIADMNAPVTGIFIMIFGNIFVILIESILVLTQTLRLSFYEWFSKFYAGDGMPFTPISIQKDVFNIQ